MRNLVVCCDGTWNTADQEKDGVPTPTNVVRLYHAIEPTTPGGIEQVSYYHPGVGSEGNFIQKAAGGGFGLGLSKNIMSGYKWLADEYQPDDRIFLFGFSRGAYTVRSLAGMITACGLLKLSEVGVDKAWPLVEKAMDAYREKKARSAWAKGLAFHGKGNPKTVPVHFLGVWDTVGALGIPNDLAILDLLDNFFNHSFHDTTLSDNVLNARHAVAIDERRLPFSPTLWTGDGAKRKTVKQVWFPGVHSDVGGGYAEIGLSNCALQWMFSEAIALGMAFHPGMVQQSKADPSGILHDSFRGAIKGLKSRPRSMPDLTTETPEVHESVRLRRKNPPIAQGRYRETVHLDVGKSTTVDIFAAEPWNSTNIFVKARQKYVFTSKGEWLDWHDRSSPDGLDDGKFQIGDIARKFGSALGLIERSWKAVTKNDEADMKFTRRHEDMPWFSLVGSVANGKLKENGDMQPHQAFAIGSKSGEVSVRRSGYLYAYANDAWHMYDNNKGSVKLTVKRVK